MTHLPPDFWQPIPIQPIPTLATLRNMVLERSTKRMPRWKFRLSDDMVVQIQPQPIKLMKPSITFKSVAVIRECADATLLQRSNDRSPDSWLIGFDITDNWYFKTRRAGFHRDHTQADILVVRDRLISTLPIVLDRLRPSAMLKPSCLCCGKMLTDPVSMSRWTGPECYGSSSVDLPRLVSPAEEGDHQYRALG